MRRTITLLLIFVGARAGAQNSIDIFTLTQRFGTAVEAEEFDSLQSQETVTNVNLKLPIVLNSGNVWYNALSYNNSQLGFSGLENNPERLNLHAFYFQTGFIKKWEDNRSLMVVALPRLMTDLKELNHRGFQLGGYALYGLAPKENFDLKLGISYNDDLFGAFVNPLISMDWQISDKWNFNMLFPLRSELTYRFKENVKGGVYHFAPATSYSIGETNDFYVQKIALDGGLFMRHKLWSNFFLEERVAYTVIRSYDIYDVEEKLDLRISAFEFGKERTLLSPEFSKGLAFELRLVYSIKTE